jgi:RNA polymerase sigma-70 factor (ECF subfamily)
VDRKRELALIDAAKRGDSEAFTELYNAYVDQIYRYIYYRVSSVTVAEDLTADVFVRVLESLSTYEDRSVALLAWLYRIAHARVIDYYRRARHTDNQEDIEALQIMAETDLDSPLMKESDARALQRAIRSLSEDQQQVIILRFIEGHSLEKTAGLIGKTVVATKSLQYRAVQSLGRVLGKQGFSS